MIRLLLALALQAAPDPGAAAPAPPQAVLVLSSGQSMVVRSYSADGDRVRIVDLTGAPLVLRASLVDLEQSRRATGEHRARLEKQRVRAAAVTAPQARRAGAFDTAPPAAAGSAGPSATSGSRPRLLLFTARWCGWCRKLKKQSLADQAVREQLGRYAYQEVDIDEEPELARRYGVSGVPALVRLDGSGKLVKRSSGYLAPQALLAWLK